MELSDYQRDILIRTALGEAAGEGPEGMEAVLHVILNRANSGKYPSDPANVALQGNKKTGYHAFSAWNSTDKEGNNPKKWSKSSAAYETAEQALNRVLGGGADPTGGAIYYHTPNVSPSWSNKANTNGTKRIGNHVFYPTSGGGPSGGGSDVSAYQQQLAQRGFDPGAIDGIRGPRTTAAVKAFQQANGLVADGIVGPKTMAALQGQARPQTQRQPPPSFTPSFGDQAGRAFGSTGGDMESPLSRLGTTRLDWNDDGILLNSTDIRAPVDPVEYARARDQAVNTRGAADPSIFSLLQPQQAGPPPLMPRSRPMLQPTPPSPMPGRPASLMPPMPLSPTSGARPALTTGVQPAGTVQMPPGARPASVGPAPPLPPLSPFGPSLGAGTWGSMAAAPVVQTSPFARPPMPRMPPAGMNRAPPQVPMPRVRMTGSTVVNKSGETYDQRRARQIAEGKASQLDEFGMIR